MHVEEQEKEIEDCVGHYGLTPSALLAQKTPALAPNFVAVHCTHTSEEDLHELGAKGVIACLCPLTEAHLADGLPDLSRWCEHGVRVCLGSDCNARIDFAEEMRWLEYSQRLHQKRRGVFTFPTPNPQQADPSVVDACKYQQQVYDRGGPVASIFTCATANGADALGIKVKKALIFTTPSRPATDRSLTYFIRSFIN
jgi:cytosine/adenosine deaminase-related metal-dependent hydrolase